jgi:hypothetical protein
VKRRKGDKKQNRKREEVIKKHTNTKRRKGVDNKKEKIN